MSSLLLVHPAHAVLDDDRDLEGEGRDRRPRRFGTVGSEDVAVAVLVLQAFAVQRRAAGGRAEQEAARALVAGRPDQVADALEAEHRIEDEERDHVDAVRRVRRAGGDEAKPSSPLR